VREREQSRSTDGDVVHTDSRERGLIGERHTSTLWSCTLGGAMDGESMDSL
jgi:hypothetical protein